jgi:hypothetical protein
MGFQKRLLRGVKIGGVKRSAAGHAAHREEVRSLAALVEVHHGLVPIHLAFAAPVIALRHKRLPRGQPQFFLPSLHVAPHRRFRYRWVGMFSTNPLPDSVRRVPLLVRRFPIAPQNPVDELSDRPQSRTASPRRLALRRNRTGQRLPHHPPVRLQLLRHPLDRSHPIPILTPNLLEQFHLTPPVHRPPVDTPTG